MRIPAAYKQALCLKALLLLTGLLLISTASA